MISVTRKFQPMTLGIHTEDDLHYLTKCLEQVIHREERDFHSLYMTRTPSKLALFAKELHKQLTR